MWLNTYEWNYAYEYVNFLTVILNEKFWKAIKQDNSEQLKWTIVSETSLKGK